MARNLRLSGCDAQSRKSCVAIARPLLRKTGVVSVFKVLILVCSINLAPADCQTDTAVDVISGPEAVNQSVCGLYGQAYIADTAVGAALRDDEYVKVKCTHTAIGKIVG